ncbi:MAG: hypothetical protein JAY88_02535 [Candidatus Thiodiazotropha lotti]|nr:hypothetical protein [Candidatus Thiodiazotropha lotti]MCW4185943.1 hypothetical protein [Candidatus Thiodiazotropha lotti]
MSELQGLSTAASRQVSSNPPGADQQISNQADQVDVSTKSKLQQVTGELSTEQRLLNLSTSLDQYRGSGNKSDNSMALESAVIGRAAHSGSDLASHQNPITTISNDVTADAAKALLRNDLDPATTQQVKNIVEQLGDGIQSSKVATGINKQFAQNISNLANANPSSAEFKGALAQLTRMAEISSQNSLAAGTKIAFDPGMGQQGIEKFAKLPPLDVPDIDSDIYYKTADGILHMDSAKSTPNTLATEIKDSIGKEDTQLNRQQEWQQKSTSELPRQLGLFVLDEGSSKTGTGNLLHPNNLDKLAQVVNDPDARVIAVDDRVYSVNDLYQISHDRAMAAEPSISSKRDDWVASGKPEIDFAKEQYGPALKQYFEQNKLTSFVDIFNQLGKSYGVPKESLNSLSSPELPSVKQGGTIGAITSGIISTISVAKDGNVTVSDAGEIGKNVFLGGALGVLSAQGERLVTPLADRAIGNTVQQSVSKIAANKIGQSSVQAASNGLAARTVASRLVGSSIVGAAVSSGISVYENWEGLKKAESSSIGNVAADTAVGGASVAAAVATGAAVGSVVPLFGTAVGAVTGLVVGVGVAYVAQISGARDTIANGIANGVDYTRNWF